MGCQPDYSVAFRNQEDSLLIPDADGRLTEQAAFPQFYRPVQIYQIQLISHVATSFPSAWVFILLPSTNTPVVLLCSMPKVPFKRYIIFYIVSESP